VKEKESWAENREERRGGKIYLIVSKESRGAARRSEHKTGLSQIWGEGGELYISAFLQNKGKTGLDKVASES